MLERLKIRGKIWVGITAVIAGYVSSMVLSIYLGRNGERVILSITRNPPSCNESEPARARSIPEPIEIV